MRSRKYFYYFDGNYPQDVANMGYNVWNWDAQDSVMWQESGKVNRVANNGDPVAVWTDTVSGVDAIQATTANKPTYATASLNGLPTLSFDGSDLLATGNIAIGTFAVWVVFKSTVADRTIYEQSADSFANDGMLLLLTISNNARFNVKRGATNNYKSTTSTVPAGFNMLRIEQNATNTTHKIFFANVEQSVSVFTGGNVGTGTATQPLTIGGRGSLSGVMTGNIAHLCIVSPYPTPAIIAQMESYINQKWGIYTDDAIADASNTYTVFDWDASRSDTLFQDSGATTPVTSDTDPVGAWVDRISSINAIQATTANKPTYSAGSLNGLPTLSFDGSDLLATGNISISTFAVWCVSKSTSSGAAYFYEHGIGSFSSGNGFGLLDNLPTGADVAHFVRVATTKPQKHITLTPASFTLFRHEYNNSLATMNLYVNNTLSSATTDSVGDPTYSQNLTFNMGARGDLLGAMTGNIAELVIVTPYPDATTIARIEAQLNEKWGIY